MPSVLFYPVESAADADQALSSHRKFQVTLSPSGGDTGLLVAAQVDVDGLAVLRINLCHAFPLVSTHYTLIWVVR